jgi:hypothetical protein
LGTCIVTAAVILTGCSSHSIQTTSGKDYLERHNISSPTQTTSNPGSNNATSFDEALRQVASIEPTLTFPARIGIAKMGPGGSLLPLHPEELEAWSATASNLGTDYGSIMPINPLIFDQALSEATELGIERTTGLQKVRLAAARQHLDAVIAFETQGQATRETNVLAVSDLTIIGAYVLPSRKIEGQGYAAGVILDPISGYPYGQIEAAAEDSAHATWVNSRTKEADLEQVAAINASVALAKETEKAFQGLRLALAEQRADAKTN